MQLSKGKGLGLADMLVRQLMRNGCRRSVPQALQDAAAARARKLTPPVLSSHDGAPTMPGRSRAGFREHAMPAAQQAGAQLGRRSADA